jgi:hypothetical protein
MCVSDIEHQPRRLSEVLRQIAISRRCVGNFTAAGVDLRHHTAVCALVPQRNRYSKVRVGNARKGSE